jgi:hypothetical protein
MQHIPLIKSKMVCYYDPDVRTPPLNAMRTTRSSVAPEEDRRNGHTSILTLAG